VCWCSSACMRACVTRCGQKNSGERHVSLAARGAMDWPCSEISDQEDEEVTLLLTLRPSPSPTRKQRPSPLTACMGGWETSATEVRPRRTPSNWQVEMGHKLHFLHNRIQKKRFQFLQRQPQKVHSKCKQRKIILFHEWKLFSIFKPLMQFEPISRVRWP
jgi:hypothetical protein